MSTAPRAVWALTMRWLAALLPIAAMAHAQSASPVLLVLEKGARSLAIVDPGRLEVVARVDAGDDPHEVVASEDGRLAYISNYGAFSTPGHTLSVVDVAARKVLQTIPVDTKFANRLKFTPDGKRVLVSDLGTGDLLVLDAGARRELKRINLGHAAAGLLVVPDGSRAYVAVSPDDQVAVVDLQTLSVTGRLVTEKGPDGMAWAAAAR